MKILGVPVPFTKNIQPITTLTTGWLSKILEPFTGAWQRNIEIDRDSVMSFGAVYSCVTLISSDIGKLRPKLMQWNSAAQVWLEIKNAAYSPVLRKPNSYQTWQKFAEQWIVSKLLTGNTYVYKERDQRGVVVRLHVLDPRKVTPLITSDGGVYYQLSRDDLANVPPGEEGSIVVPASEMIHDTMVALYHPLVGVSPIFACGLAAMQGINIQKNSVKFFENMSRPSGILSAPAEISDTTAERIKKHWDSNFGGGNIGKIAVLGDGLEYQAMTITASDSQLIEQLKWTAENICSCFHVPLFKIGIGALPSNPEHGNQMYYSDCLQALIESMEAHLDEGLKLGTEIKIELDLEGLIRMDRTTQVAVLNDSVKGGWMMPDEARRKQGMLPVPGGNTPYMQQQNYSLAALAKRDSGEDPFGTAKPEPAEPAEPAEPIEEEVLTVEDEDTETELALDSILSKTKVLFLEDLQNVE